MILAFMILAFMIVAFMIVAFMIVAFMIVVFVVPVALVHLPALLIVIIVRVIPVGAFVGRTVPVSLDPAVVVAVGNPISLHPGVARAGHRSLGLVAEWRRRGFDVDRNLG